MKRHLGLIIAVALLTPAVAPANQPPAARASCDNDCYIECIGLNAELRRLNTRITNLQGVIDSTVSTRKLKVLRKRMRVLKRQRTALRERIYTTCS